MKTIIAAAIVCVASIAAVAECSDADRKALEAFDRAWAKAGETGDKVSLMAIYSDDYMGLPAMQNKASAIEATMQTFEENKTNPNPNPDKVTYDHYIISCTPSTATITHRNTVWTANGTGGKAETFYTRSIHFLEKRGGKWQVVSNAGSGLDDYDVIWYLEQDWNDAIWKKNRDWFEKNFASDFTSISSETAQLMSRKQDIDSTVNDKSTFDMVETTGINIRIDGNYAVVTGTFRLKGKDEKGMPFDRKMRYTDTWIKRDGRWQAWSSQGTMIPSGPQVAKN